jgi:hypothetical protein
MRKEDKMLLKYKASLYRGLEKMKKEEKEQFDSIDKILKSLREKVERKKKDLGL